MKRIPYIVAIVAALALTGCAGGPKPTNRNQTIAEQSAKTKAAMSSYTSKTTPVGADTVLISDSEASNATKKASLSTMRAALGLGTTDNPSFLSVHASGGNLAAANKQVTKAWVTGLPYVADVTSVIHGGKHYICTSTHTAGSTTEPGVGASWATVWSEVSGAGDNLGSATYSDVVGLWTTCTGYLKSDGSCDTPSGSMTYPGAGIAYTTSGTAWATSLGLVTTIGATGADTNLPTEQAVREAFSALPNLAFDSATLTTTTVGNTDTISVKANTFQAYDADLTDLADGSLTGSKVAGCATATATKAADYTIGTDSTNEAYGGTIYVTSAATITAQSIAPGHNYCVVTIGDIAVSLDVNASDKMVLDGVTLADGDKATNTSKSGDTICCQYYSADGQYCWSGTVLGGHWTDGN